MGEWEINDWSRYNLHFHYHLIYPNDTRKIVTLDIAHPSNKNSLWSPTQGSCRYLHTGMDMLMRPIAGLYTRSSQPGESQIEIKLYPEPPKKMPTGLNNEHLTRKAFDYHHQGHNSLVFPGAHFAHIFALSRERESIERKTVCVEWAKWQTCSENFCTALPKSFKPLGKLVCIR